MVGAGLSFGADALASGALFGVSGGGSGLGGWFCELQAASTRGTARSTDFMTRHLSRGGHIKGSSHATAA
jgi:hypothetical protein